MRDWDPSEYLRFEAERTRPSRDLAARVDVPDARDVIDIGCGPGNSTRVLRERWPGAAIIGLDSSPAMIEQAREDYPEGNWVVADAAAFGERGRFDVLFSNATLQWIPGHDALVPRLFDALRPGGALAAQVPAFSKMPIHGAIREVAGSAKWRTAMEGRGDAFAFHDLGYYYDLLCRDSSRIEAWETLYCHVLPSRSAILDFVGGAGLRPYLDALPDEAGRKDFMADLAAAIGDAYPERADGKVLFPFDRLFFIAYK